MATLIDKGYFIADINLPKSDIDNIQEFINKYEEKVLIELLGYELYKLTLVQTEDLEDRIKDIINGCEYEVNYNNRITLVKWGGLKNAKKESLIAYYVYVYYLKEQVVTVQQNGTLKSKNENSSLASPFGKIMSAWMKFENLYGSSTDSILNPSAYNFLNSKKDVYPEWIFSELKGSINGHDL